MRPHRPFPAQADRRVAGSALARSGGLWCVLICWLAACGPNFPPFWLIEADPLGTDGTVDEQGKLRVLAIVAEPPEVRPGEAVQLTSLVVTHPQHGQVQDVGGTPRRTPWPRGVTALWLVCVPAEGQAAFEPCGLEQGMPGTPPVLLAAGAPLVFGPTAVLAAAPAGGAGFDLLVTLVVADHTQAGGAQACYDRARENHGVSPSQNHCLVATKRIRVSQAAVPNRNPALAAVWLGSQASGGVRLDQAAATFRWNAATEGRTKRRRCLGSRSDRAMQSRWGWMPAGPRGQSNCLRRFWSRRARWKEAGGASWIWTVQKRLRPALPCRRPKQAGRRRKRRATALHRITRSSFLRRCEMTGAGRRSQSVPPSDAEQRPVAAGSGRVEIGGALTARTMACRLVARPASMRRRWLGGVTTRVPAQANC